MKSDNCLDTTEFKKIKLFGDKFYRKGEKTVKPFRAAKLNLYLNRWVAFCLEKI